MVSFDFIRFKNYFYQKHKQLKQVLGSWRWFYLSLFTFLFSKNEVASPMSCCSPPFTSCCWCSPSPPPLCSRTATLCLSSVHTPSSPLLIRVGCRPPLSQPLVFPVSCFRSVSLTPLSCECILFVALSLSLTFRMCLDMFY